MQTACTAPPPSTFLPFDPSLFPSINFALLDRKQTILNPDEPLSDRQAIALAFSHELFPKAVAHEACGRSSRMHKCPDSHFFREGRSCNQRFCENCFTRMLNELCDRYLTTIDRIEAGVNPMNLDHSQHFIITLSAPILRSSDAIRAHGKAIGPALQRIAGDPSSVMAWWRTQGFVDGLLISKIIYSGPYVSHDRIRSTMESAFPGSSVSVRVRDNRQFGRGFREMAETILPDSPEERAAMEALFHRTRALHVIGQDHLNVDHPVEPDYDSVAFIGESPDGETPDQHNDPALFTEETDPVNNEAKPLKTGGHRCPKCGQASIAATPWFPKNLSADDIAGLPYFPLKRRE